MERGGVIFPPRSWLARRLLQARRLVRFGYDAKALEDELSRIFHSRVFGDTTVRLCIPSFEGRHGEPWIYKTPHHPDYRNDRHEKMVKVGLATAAAPTFVRALEHDGYMMVDGGLWANDPISRYATAWRRRARPMAGRYSRCHAGSIAQCARASIPLAWKGSRDADRRARIREPDRAR
jgi:patatin-like phospholipase/acyl hydrolase